MITRIEHIGQMVTPVGDRGAHGSAMGQVRIVENAVIVMDEGRILYAGEESEVPATYRDCEAECIDAQGHCVLPGFVDSHTHFVFGGYREKEFMMRLQGAQYMEIMRMGGGIQSTVNATKQTSKEELLSLGRERLFGMLKQGITTVEGKSGYGLDLETELKQLEVMEELDREQPVDVVKTYLGAHAVPTDFQGDPDGYVDYIIRTVLPAVKEQGITDICDVFCEDGVFSMEQSRRLLEAAREQGFRLKMHADEIEPMGGGGMGAELGCVSCDHLLMVDDAGIKKLASSDTVATLLPCTAFCLNKPYAPARKLIDNGCAVALASDFNPGSCFCNSLPMMIALAVIHMQMTVEEAITALTLNGAAALGLADTVGTIEEGKQADLVILKYPDYRFLVYNTGSNVVGKVIKKGSLVYQEELA